MSKRMLILGILGLPLAFLSIQAQTAEKKSATAVVSGRVTLKGEPAQSVSVALHSHNEYAQDTDAVMRARTDGAGHFHIDGVAAGQYSVIAFAPGAISPNDMDFSGKSRFGKTIKVSEGENVENIDLTLTAGGVISGRVTDSEGRAFVGEPVTLFRRDQQGEWRQYSGPPNGVEMFYTDDRGIYRIFGLPEGRYIISAGYEELSGWNTAIPNRTYYPRAFHPSAPDESQAKVIEVTEGSEGANVDIRLGAMKRTYDLYGIVVNADTGQPAPGLLISYGAVRDGQITYTKSGSERSGANGEFRVVGIMPGKYGINADSQGDVDLICDQVMVEITDSDLNGIVIKGRPGASVNGVVVIEGTTDPKTLSLLSQVRLFVQTDGRMSLFRQIRVNADGGFQVRGLGKGRLMISVIQFEDLSLRLKRIELNGAPREAIEVNPGEQITGLKVVLTPEGNQ